MAGPRCSEKGGARDEYEGPGGCGWKAASLLRAGQVPRLPLTTGLAGVWVDWVLQEPHPDITKQVDFP